MLTVFLSALFLSASLHAKTVTLGPADNHTTVALNLGDTLAVALEDPQLRGYRWQLQMAADSPLTALDDRYTPPANSNATGTRTFRFNAARTGETKLEFAFSKTRPGPAPETTSTFSVQVHIASGAAGNDGYIGDAILIATYRSALPCIDCGDLEELRLYAKGKFDSTGAFFLRILSHRGGNGNSVTADRGQWYVLKGDAVDPNATVYQLIFGSPGQSEYLLFKGDSLVQLDRHMRPLAAGSKLNLILHRVQ